MRIVSGFGHNYAVLVAPSMFFKNYRHTANILEIYRFLKQHDFPDENIILMLSGEIDVDNRNPNMPSIIGENNPNVDLMKDVQVDYYGSEVTLDTFENVLLNKMNSSISFYRQLHSDANREGFFKFRETEDLTTKHLSMILNEMYILKRYKHILLFLDTCQSSSLQQYPFPPNILSISSSTSPESSYSYGYNRQLGVTLTDQFTYYLLQALQSKQYSTLTIHQLITYYLSPNIQSTPNVVSTIQKPYTMIKLSSFFSFKLKIKFV
ncbi:hypothetical protein WA158_001258 [Blastocystis sp. Blastoise]